MIRPTDTYYNTMMVAFCVIVVLANIIGAKMVSIADFSIPAGLIVYPLTFFLSDLVTEIYGAKKAKMMVYTAFGMAILSFLIIKIVLLLPAYESENGKAFEAILGLNGLMVFASLTAFGLSQLLDIQLYALIRRWTGPRLLWLRNNGSTLVAQIADTIVVNLIHLYWGLGMELLAVIKVMLFFYLFKAFFSLINTPLFYLCVHLFKGSRKPLPV